MSENTTSGLGGIHDEQPDFQGTAQEALEHIIQQANHDLKQATAGINELDGNPEALAMGSQALGTYAENLLNTLTKVESELGSDITDEQKEKITQALESLEGIKAKSIEGAQRAKALSAPAAPETPSEPTNTARTPVDKPSTDHDNAIAPDSESVQTQKFFVIPFGDNLPSDKKGSYVWASPAGDGQENPSGQQYFKIYVSKTLAESGAYLENLERLSHSRGLDVDLSVRTTKEGSYELFEVAEPITPKAKEMFYLNSEDKPTTLKVNSKLRNAFVDHFSLSVDREICQRTCQTTAMGAAGAAQLLTTQNAQARFLQRAAEEPGTKEMFAAAGISQEQMASFYDSYTNGKSVKQLLSGKLPNGKTVEVDGQPVDAVAQNLCFTQEAQLPASVKSAMAADPELLMAVTLTRTLQRSVADHIVEQNNGVIGSEMDKLESKQDAHGQLLLPRESKDHPFKLFKRGRLNSLNEEYSQLYAFRYVGMASHLEGSKLLDTTNVFSKDDVDTNPRVLGDKNVEDGQVGLSEYLAGRRKVLAEITDTDLHKARQKGLKGEVTTTGAIMGSLDEIKYQNGQPPFGEKAPEKEKKDFKAFFLILDEMAGSVKDILEGIEGKIDIV